jgi:hypothetical protein
VGSWASAARGGADQQEKSRELASRRRRNMRMDGESPQRRLLLLA